VTAVVAKNSTRAWIKAGRPQTLGATLCPVLIGTALAKIHGSFSTVFFILALVTAMLLQVLANVINDYGDFIKGSDTAERLGPPRAMQMGWITKRVMEQGILSILVCTICLGSLLVMRGGVPILLAGTLGILICCWYTLGTRPLAYLGFVEILIFFIFGPGEVLGAYYVQSLSWCSEAFVIAISPGFLAAALNLTNNLRDVNEDRKHQKLTIAVRCGERFTRVCIITLVVLSYLGPVMLVIFYGYSWLLLVSGAALIMPMRHAPMILAEPVSKRFNLMLKSLGQAAYLFGVLASLGIIYGAP
jgi:1,4-dihydroxy-2-naphthoate polyprenyltransferase